MLDLPPEGEESMPCIFLCRERDILEAPDIDATEVAIHPEGICSIIKLHAHLRAGWEYAKVRALM
jgi:hypothetical protein